MNTLDQNYLQLIDHVLDTGHMSGDRTGTGTVKTFGNLISHNMSEGFPLLTCKKMFHKGIIHELLWFLKGDTNIKYLVDNNVNIWVGDCFKKWLNTSNHYVSMSYEYHSKIVLKFDIISLEEYQKVAGEEYPSDGTLGSFMISNIIDGKDIRTVVTSNSNIATFNGKEDIVESIKQLLTKGFTWKLKNDAQFAKVWGELNKVYGAEWVNWDDDINQVQELIDSLRKNPDSRRMLVTAWNPTNVRNAVLPPCHLLWQVFTRELTAIERENYYAELHDFTDDERMGMNPNASDEEVHTIMNEAGIPSRELSLMFYMRSVDVGLGLPFDIASYGFLLSMIAAQTNMKLGELKWILADTHIYKNQIEELKTLKDRENIYTLPKLTLNPNVKSIFDYTFDDIKIENYRSHPELKLKLSN